MTANLNFDAIVIGAGYIGYSAANQLCIKGLRTAPFGISCIATVAAGENYRSIQIQDVELEKSIDMILLAKFSFSILVSQLDWKLGIRTIGSLIPIEKVKELFIAIAFLFTLIVTPLVAKINAQLIATGTNEWDVKAFLPERNAYVSH